MTGLKVTTDNIPKFKKQLAADIERALEAVGEEAEGDSKDICPFRTGHLKKNITHRVAPHEKAVYVGTNVVYALAVHEGTHRSKANPWMKRALNANQSTYVDIIKKYLKTQDD